MPATCAMLRAGTPMMLENRPPIHTPLATNAPLPSSARAMTLTVAGCISSGAVPDGAASDKPMPSTPSVEPDASTGLHWATTRWGRRTSTSVKIISARRLTKTNCTERSTTMFTSKHHVLYMNESSFSSGTRRRRQPKHKLTMPSKNGTHQSKPRILLKFKKISLKNRANSLKTTGLRKQL